MNLEYNIQIGQDLRTLVIAGSDENNYYSVEWENEELGCVIYSKELKQWIGNTGFTKIIAKEIGSFIWSSKKHKLDI